MYTVTSDLPKVTRFIVINPDAEPTINCTVAQSRYITNSAYSAWLKYQDGCKIYVVRDGLQEEIDYRLLMLLGVRDARKMVPAIYSWDKQAEPMTYVYNQE